MSNSALFNDLHVTLCHCPLQRASFLFFCYLLSWYSFFVNDTLQNLQYFDPLRGIFLNDGCYTLVSLL